MRLVDYIRKTGWKDLCVCVCVCVCPSRFLRGCWFDTPDRVARFLRGSFVPVGSIFFSVLNSGVNYFFCKEARWVTEKNFLAWRSNFRMSRLIFQRVGDRFSGQSTAQPGVIFFSLRGRWINLVFWGAKNFFRSWSKNLGFSKSAKRIFINFSS